MRTITLLSLLVALIAVFPQRILPAFSALLVVDESAELDGSADAIVILLGGGPERVLHAVSLYQKKQAPRIIVGSGYKEQEIWSQLPPGVAWPTSSDIYIEALRQMGVPSQDIIEVDTSEGFDTAGELQAISRHVEAAGWDSLILVSTASHTRRVALIWNRVAAVSGTVIAAPLPGFSHWWTRGYYIRTIGYEYAALVKEGWMQVLHLSSQLLSELVKDGKKGILKKVLP